MEKFEGILMNYVNGNRADAKQAVQQLSANELQDFKGWLKEEYKENNPFVFEFVVFLL